MQDGLFFDSWTGGWLGHGGFASDHYWVQANNSATYKHFVDHYNEVYFRVRLQPKVISNYVAPSFYDTVTGATLLSFSMDTSTGYFCFKNAAGAVIVGATSDVPSIVNRWYLIELYVNIADAPDGVLIAYVDGNKIIQYNGDTKFGVPDSFNRIYFSSGSNGGGHDIWIDDLAMNDTGNNDGKNDIAWCGDGIIVPIDPLQDGAHSNWHGSDGNDVDNFEMCNEFPADGDTTYVYHDGTAAGTQQQFGMDATFSGLNKTVLRIYAEARVSKTAVDDHHIKIGTLAAGGVDVLSADQDLYTGAYHRYVGPEAKINPVDSAAWEEADIDALEFVAEVGA